MESNRYGKNVKTVIKICKILGYRLISYEPNWTMAPVEEKLPKRLLELVSNQTLGRYDTIPDEFMGRIALIMGFDWEFPIQDDQLKMFITQCGELVKDAEGNEELRLQNLEKEIRTKKDEKTTQKMLKIFKKESDDYISEIKAECDQKIKTFEFMVKFREKLRNWNKKDDGKEKEIEKDIDQKKEMYPDSEAADEALAH